MNKKIYISVLCLAVFSLFTSCGNVLESPVSEPETSTPAVQYATITGSVGLQGAYPAEVVQRSANPTLPDGSYYYVKATSTAGTVECQVGNDKTYQLGPLQMGVAWTIEAGVRQNSNSNSTVYMKDVYPTPVTLTESTSTFTHSFVLKNISSTGTGTIALRLQVPSAEGAVTAVCENLSLPAIELTGTNAILNVSDVPSGNYEISFYYLSSTENTAFPLFSTVQTVCVFTNMTTSTWVNDSGAGEVITDGDGNKIFKITATDIQNYANTHIYVGDPGTGRGVSDGPQAEGGPYSPLATLGRAISMIQNNGQGGDYHIYITGTQSGAFQIPPAIDTSKARSIEISGTGDTRAVLDASEAPLGGSVLLVNSSVPITLRNIQLTGGLNNCGGGIYMDSGSKVTLAEGALVGRDVQQVAGASTSEHGNQANHKGGGIYVYQATLILKNGSKVCNNYVSSSYAATDTGAGGGGISLYGGSLTIENGAVISYNKTETYRGGGILVPDGTDNVASVITMTGGEISHNESGWYGGGVMIGHTGNVAASTYPAKTFNFYGGKISHNTVTSISAYVPLSGGAGVFLDGGTFTMKGNAVIERNNATLSGGEGAGGGIAISASGKATGTFNMTGGVIRNNSANKGGAIYFDNSNIENSFNISNTASIPYGVVPESGGSGVQGLGKNDVFIGNTGSLNIAASLDASFPEVGISTGDWQRGKTIVKIASSVTVNQELQNKFRCCSLPSDDWEKISSSTKISVNCPFYVGSYNGSYGLDTNEGTRTSPYKTIAKACEQMTEDGADYIIKITGTTDAVAQSIPNSVQANSISIIGVSDASHPPIINRGLWNVAASGAGNGSALTINSTVPVTITNVKITGGWTTGNGGGIDLESSGTLSLGDGVLVTGNRADSSGGGLFTRNGTIFIYGTAQIGQRPSDKVTTAPIANSVAGNCANWTNMNGGGICVSESGDTAGHIYLGYTKNSAGNPEKDENFTGGIYYNYAQYGGGAIFASGSEEQKPVVWISGGTVAYNYANGTGGGIKNSFGNIELYGGTIKQNNAGSHGGAIVHDDGSLAFKGTVSIPCGTGTISATNPLNDVWIADEKSVSLDSNFARVSNSEEKIALTPEMPARNLTLLTGLVNTTNIAYFNLNDAPGFKLSHVEQSSNHYGKTSLKNIVKTIHVSASGATDPSGNTSADDTWNNSTYAYNEYTNNQSKPFASLTKALQFITYQHSNEDYTIYMTGTFNDSYTIPASDTTVANSPITLTKGTTAKTIKIVGGSDLPSGTDPEPADIINSYSAGTYRSTITITTDVPITFEKIKISGGRATDNTTPNGGGINIASGSDVTLGAYAYVASNNAKRGGGIYNEGTLTVKTNATLGSNRHAKDSGTLPDDKGGGGIYNNGTNAKVYITGGKFIYNSASNNSASGGAIYNKGGSVFIYGDATFGLTAKGNSAGSGGCIYNAGYLYLGYSSANTNKTPKDATSWTGMIQFNMATHGAGIYNAAGSYVYMKSGKLISNVNESNGTSAYNNFGLGVWNSGTFVMNGGSIEKHVNYTRYGGGAGVFNTKDGTFDMQGGSISENYIIYRGASSYTGHGGAIYNKGTLKMRGTASIPYGATISEVLTKEAGCNDVYLADKNDDTGDGSSGMPSTPAKITVGNVSTSPAATITPPYYGRGHIMLAALTTQGETGSITDLTNYVGKFAVVQPDATVASEWKTEFFDDKTVAYLNAPIYVKGTGGSNSNDGASLSKAVTSLANAETIITNSVTQSGNTAVKYEIILSGEISKQALTESINGKAAGITLRGKDGSSTDMIKGDSNTNRDALAFWIQTSVPVLINNLKITAAANRAGSSGITESYPGGGILVSANANVTLADGVLVTRNYAKRGAGIFNKGTLTVTGSGNTDATRCVIRDNSADRPNAVVRYGGGIYNEGTLNVKGYALIEGNTATGDSKGGAIYNCGTLNMEGNFSIPDGTFANNDIYILNNNPITITGAINGTSPVAKISVKDNATNGIVLLQKDEGVSGSNFTAAVAKFEMTQAKSMEMNSENDQSLLINGVPVNNLYNTTTMQTAINKLTKNGDALVLKLPNQITGFSADVVEIMNNSTYKFRLDLTQAVGESGGIHYASNILSGFSKVSELCIKVEAFRRSPMINDFQNLGKIYLYGSVSGENHYSFGNTNLITACPNLQEIVFVDAQTVYIAGGLLNLNKSGGGTYTGASSIIIRIPESCETIYIQDRFASLSDFDNVKIVYEGDSSSLTQAGKVLRYTSSSTWDTVTNGIKIYYDGTTDNYKTFKPNANAATGTWQ